MSVVLYRVDERLIHGQVVLGWGRRLHPARYVVVDDALTGSEWEQDLYRLSVDASVALEFLATEEAREALPGFRADAVRTVILTRDVDHMRRLAAGGLMEGEEVNLGGLHHRPGRSEVRSYLHLDEGDRACVRQLSDAGVNVTGQDLPEAVRVPLDDLLG